MTLRKKYLDSGLLDPKMLATDANALIYQVPGGMLSNLLSQLKQAGKEDQLQDEMCIRDRIRAMQEEDLDIASEFLEMAARLVHLKSVSLLPKHEEAEALKQDLTGQLLERCV